MNEDLYRKKSLDKITSPESLNDYIRVSNPRVWILLAGIIVLLAGVCVWAVFGHIDRFLTTVVRVDDGRIICYVDPEDINDVRVGMTVVVGDLEGTVSEIGLSDEYGYSCLVESDGAMEDGLYSGKIVIERIRPISFVTN